jgi:predicted nucleic acid-binding protein
MQHGSLCKFNGLDPELAVEALRQTARLFNEIFSCAPLKDRALAIALDLRHPYYDCFYLALGERYDAQVGTFDERLFRVCVAPPMLSSRLIR